MNEAELAARHPAEYQWLLDRVKPVRAQNPRAFKRERWWIFGENQPGMRRAVRDLDRYIATTETAKHRHFQFFPRRVLAEGTITIIALDDAYFLGVLESRIHTVWALAAGGTLENRPRYNKTLCFDPFPFPACSDEQKARVRALGETLDAHRKHRQELHPELTLTGMYNVLEKLRSGEALNAKEKAIHEQGLVSVLKQLHHDLDAAVLDAYGWPHDLTDEQILERVVALNAERVEEEREGLVRWLRPEFQSPGGAREQTQVQLPGAELSEEVEAATAALSAWPKTLPEQFAAVRDLLSQGGAWGMERVARSFKGARRREVESVLDSLAALGIALSYESPEGKLWRGLERELAAPVR